jgi:hypothetical protein
VSARLRLTAGLLASLTIASILIVPPARRWIAANPDAVEDWARQWYLTAPGADPGMLAPAVPRAVVDTSLNVSYPATAVALVLAGLSAALMLGAAWLPGRRTLPIAGLALVVVAQVVVFASTGIRLLADGRPPPEIMSLLNGRAEAPGQFRVLTITDRGNEYTRPNLLLPLGLEEVGGYVNLPLQATELLVALALEQPRIRELLGVRYVLAPRGNSPDPRVQSRPGTDVLVGESQIEHVVQYGSYLPRAFGVQEIRPASDLWQTREMLSDPQFDPRASAVVERPPAWLTERFARPARVILESYEPERVVLQVDAPEDGGFVVLTHTFYPGWRAYANGAEIPILRTDIAVRGVVVPGGHSTIAFAFNPIALYVGIAASLLGMFLIGALYWWQSAPCRRLAAAVSGVFGRHDGRRWPGIPLPEAREGRSRG